jgi:PmbA protein
MDQVICPDFINITEEPHLESAFGSTYFDAEGVKTNPRVLVDKGMLTGYLLSSYSARRLNLITTGNAGGHHNLVVEPTVESGLEDIIKSMGTGLMVTSLIGHGVNIVNGDYSRGATGFWVENGEIQYPVSEITIAGNLRDMLNNILLVGKDLNSESSIICGTILLDDLMVAGY